MIFDRRLDSSSAEKVFKFQSDGTTLNLYPVASKFRDILW